MHREDLGSQWARSPARAQARACLFDTALGRCAIAWGAGGVLAVQLPDADDPATLARLGRGLPALVGVAQDESPAPVRGAIDGIVALLRGEPRHLREVPLDMARIPAFHRQVYRLTRDIAPGSTISYGELARGLGEPGAARAVGQALGANPFVIVVPCHRVLAARGRAGGFSAPGGLRTKARLLAIESACAPPPAPGSTGSLFA
ncbi:MAG: methylated-DNA--[protein]-cysteine S-methyltransferase [Betaproteobacteria bacterium]|nr:methylated-DNA--[protein]-cysteine S-methyltransferase [Betaproteobacteria bacterium]